MAKTLIQLANEVGKNLRRSTGTDYTTITQNQDVVFIVQAINEAKRMVEDAWKWDVLRTTITFDSVGSTEKYDTSDLAIVTSDPLVTTERSFVLHNAHGALQFWDVTTSEEGRLSQISRDRAEHINTSMNQDVRAPRQVAVYPNGAGLTVHFGNAPDAVRNYKFEAIVPQADLTISSTILTIAERPVILAATALAAEERGEEYNVDPSRWWTQYENALGAEIGRDATSNDLVLISDQLPYFRNTGSQHGMTGGVVY